MIVVNKVEETYYRCQSCYGSQDKDGKVVDSITIGLDNSHTSSFRLCKECQQDLVTKLTEGRDDHAGND